MGGFDLNGQLSLFGGGVCDEPGCSEPVTQQTSRRSVQHQKCRKHVKKLHRDIWRAANRCVAQTSSGTCNKLGAQLVEGVPYCSRHFQRIKKHGDPLGHLPLYSQATPSYAAVHQRLAAQRGRAKDYPCAALDCPRMAAHWAYDHQDESEVRQEFENGDVRIYSEDIFGHYRPLCVPCHSKEDSERNRKELRRLRLETHRGKIIQRTALGRFGVRDLQETARLIAEESA